MNQLLSQSEIDALLKSEEITKGKNDMLTLEEKDAIGELGNISMGTAATALYTLINRKVIITAPDVTVTTLREVSKQYPLPFVAVEVSYTEGFKGANLLIISENDVKVITDLILGGDGINIERELNEMHLSAIGEAMNQMIGSSCTSMSSMFNKSINITPPNAFLINLAEDIQSRFFTMDEQVVKIRFKLEVSGLIDSFIMQFIPITFAKEIIEELIASQISNQIIGVQNSRGILTDNKLKNPNRDVDINVEGNKPKQRNDRQVDVLPLAFREFDDKASQTKTKENIDLILDVPLQITVELGKVRKLIRDILELNPGSIIELDKMAGEPVDILVNGKMIAKGEVVVIEDSFGVRITDILSPENRVMKLGK